MLILLLIITLNLVAEGQQFPAKVLLRDVNVLTLHKDKYTTGRRNRPVPQLSCVGGTARYDSQKVETVQCTNTGFDGMDYNWKCESQLPNTLRLGKVRVNCEGYDYPDDPYILTGSCGLEYELQYTEKYYEPKPKPVVTQTVTETIHHHTNSKPTTVYVETTETHPRRDDGVPFLLLFVIFLLMAPFIFYPCCFKSDNCSYTVESEPPVVVVRDSPVFVRHTPPTPVFIPTPYCSTPSHTVIQRTVHMRDTESSTPVNDNRNDDHVSTSFGDTKRR